MWSISLRSPRSTCGKICFIHHSSISVLVVPLFLSRFSFVVFLALCYIPDMAHTPPLKLQVGTSRNGAVERTPVRRAPLERSTRLSRTFKSPVVSSPPSVAGGQVYPEQEFEALQRKLVALDAEIEELTQEGCQLDELEVHIEKMHEYNEVKDVAQMLLGRLAVVRGVTTRDLYEDYNLQLED
uniref:DNA repair protein SWI5 homolog n=1 Tax=Eptatretus burgeri TaxID=7764 RepID=A0A8C4Q3C1_EPTBU